MSLDEVWNLIKHGASQMNARYGGVVFDEWAIISLVHNKARILHYTGPRNDDFLKNFAADIGALRKELHDLKYGTGDFAFERHGIGTGFESFIVLGSGFYLICNNTRESMNIIAKDPRWLNAQVPFAELSDKFRPSPLAVTWGDTHFLKKTP